MKNSKKRIPTYILSITIVCMPSLLLAAAVDDYVITVKTDNSGATSSTEFQIPITRTTGAGYNVDCDDDGTDEVVGATTAVYPNGYTCSYSTAGTYTIRVKDNNGDKKGYRRIRFYINASTTTDVLKLLSVEQWGTAVWSSMVQAYRGAANMVVNAIDVPDLSETTSLRSMFEGCSQADPDVSGWDTSTITNLSSMFRDASAANPDVSGWNVSNVTSFASMFYRATSANPNVSNWDTSSATRMDTMFRGASSANPDVSQWNVSNVTDMSNMFRNATSADPDTSQWNTSSVTEMNGMFYNAVSADPNVTNWDVSNVTTFYSMFRNATSANPDTSQWNTSSVTTMNRMFYGATSANPDVSNWDTSNVTNMAHMFNGATSANPDVTGWNTSQVTTVANMFNGTTLFNRSLGNWNVQNLSDAADLFRNTSISVANYDALLIGWSNQTLQNGVTLSSDAQYCQGADARDSLINNSGWTVNDNGSKCVPCADVSLPLTGMHWRIVSFPCDTGSNGVEALLGSALGTYGDNADWVMYEQVDTTGSNSNDMHLLASTDTVSPGKGYWIITSVDRTMEVNTSLSGLALTTDEDPLNYGVDGSIRSPSFSRVVRSDLPATSSTHVQNWLIGNPYTLKMSVSNFFFSHDTSANGTYFEWTDAANDAYRNTILYAHDSSDTTANGYEARTAGTPGFSTQIAPMEGVFVKLHQDSDTNNNYLLLPHEK